MAKIFLTGASGYIGGDFLHLLNKLHPEYQVKALVRDATKIEAVKKAFDSNQVQVVEGDLDDSSLISRETSRADIVINLAASGHFQSVEAIHQALSTRFRDHSSPYWIQISGGSVVAAAEVTNKTRISGAGSDFIWDDLLDIEALKTFIKNYPYRKVDNYMLDVATASPHINTAVVIPPMIYGPGRGPFNQRSVQLPNLARETLKRRRAFQVGPGESRWSSIHIRDLSQIIVRLVEKAVEGKKDENLWGLAGLYFTGVGELSLSELSAQIASAAASANLLSDTSVEELDADQFESLLPHGNVLYGTNVRYGASRARKHLDWEPKEESLEETISATVRAEAKSLGVIRTSESYSPLKAHAM
uniref:NAD-dependent epimerase/dehydratase domain-containing protein n=1 Tax=Bionectria ochroleuca TaxID=29856 RepID=A0A0B7JVC1_BIOOC